MGKEGEQSRQPEFVQRKPFEHWSLQERDYLLRLGMNERGLSLYKFVTKEQDKLVSPFANCKYGCQETVWNVGEVTSEPHSLESTTFTPGLHSSTFDDRRGFIRNLEKRGEGGYLLLLLLKPQHYLAMNAKFDTGQKIYSHLKASEYTTLDSVKLSSSKSAELKRAFFSGPRRSKLKLQVSNEKIYRIGSQAQSWDDVVRILSENRE